jgi:uncharacterized protein
MPILIDGYNLMNVANILGRARTERSLEHSRLALLALLSSSLDSEDRKRTTVVFDASNAPPGLPRRTHYQGITVRFAAAYADADTLIEELIRKNSSPKRLTVVSSDHRIQRAARRRKAEAVDSDVWLGRLLGLRREREAEAKHQAEMPPVPLLSEQIDYWIRQFGGEKALAQLVERESAGIEDRRRNRGPNGDRAV